MVLSLKKNDWDFFLQSLEQLIIGKHISRYRFYRVRNVVKILASADKNIHVVLDRLKGIVESRLFHSSKDDLLIENLGDLFDEFKKWEEGLEELDLFIMYIALHSKEEKLFSSEFDKKQGGLVLKRHYFDYEIYYLDAIDDMFIVNNKNLGLRLLNRSLNEVALYSFFEGISFCTTFKKFSHDELLSVSDNFLVHITLKGGGYSILRLPNLPSISPIYWWKDNEIILTTYNKLFLCMDVKKNSLRLITTRYKRSLYTDFYDFALKALDYEVMWAQPEKYLFTFLDREQNKAGVFNYEKNWERIVACQEDVFGVYYVEDTWWLLGEDALQSISSDDQVQKTIKSPFFYPFSSLAISKDMKNEVVIGSAIVASLNNPEGSLTLYKMAEK